MRWALQISVPFTGFGPVHRKQVSLGFIVVESAVDTGCVCATIRTCGKEGDEVPSLLHWSRHFHVWYCERRRKSGVFDDPGLVYFMLRCRKAFNVHACFPQAVYISPAACACCQWSCLRSCQTRQQPCLVVVSPKYVPRSSCAQNFAGVSLATGDCLASNAAWCVPNMRACVCVLCRRQSPAAV